MARTDAMVPVTASTYADAFRLLQKGGILDATLAERLVRAAGFRHVVAHAYDTIDMRRVHQAAVSGPADLVAFLTLMRDRAPQPDDTA